MNYAQSRSYQKRARATAVTWNQDLEHQSRFADIAMALLPASLILATATALLVALI